MATLGLWFLRNFRVSTNSLSRMVVSAFLVLISQFSLSLVPSFCDSSSLFVMLAVSALVLLAVAVVGGVLKRLCRVSASAPALVFLNIFFISGLHTVVIRREVSLLMNAALYVESALLILGLYSILHGDPGYITYGSSSLLVNDQQYTPSENRHSTEDSSLLTRVRYCKKCKKYIKGFDHHCPAFGNCIGVKNHRLFMLLLIGFIISEMSFIKSSSQFVSEVQRVQKSRLETYCSWNLVISTLLFSILQVLWQVVFLMWHVYCVCFNIRTDEWFLVVAVESSGGVEVLNGAAVIFYLTHLAAIVHGGDGHHGQKMRLGLLKRWQSKEALYFILRRVDQAEYRFS